MWIALGGIGTTFLIVVACGGIRAWLMMPKVKAEDVQRQISHSLPLGTPQKDVEAWLAHRSMPVEVYNKEGKGRRIESWIADSGPRAEWPYGIRDIRLTFLFDENDRLIGFVAKEEERF